MGETADQTRTEITALREQMTSRLATLRHTADDSARQAVPIAVAAAGLGVVAIGAVVFLRHRHKAHARELVGTLKRLAESLQQDPGTSLQALGSLPSEALREVIERKPTQPPLGAKLLDTAVRAAVSTAVGFGLRTLRDRLFTPPPSLNGSGPDRPPAGRTGKPEKAAGRRGK
jgi:nucleotide-binding universal stress UspA family protein